MHTHRFRPRFEGLEGRFAPAVFYVAPAGSNAAAGSSDAPWQTLQYAADRVVAGDTVVVRAGDYAGFDLRTDGTAAAPITFRAEPGARITTRNPVTADGINLEGASWVVIEGFTVVNQPRAGIRSVVNDHVVVRGNTLDNNAAWGVFTGFSDDVLIENNVAGRSQQQHGVYVSNSGDRPVIRNNTIWGNYQAGVHMNGDASAGGDGVISGALVEGNVIYDNGRGGASAINADGVQDSTFRNNLITDAHASGISLYRIDGGGGSSGNLVVNNTVLVASDGRWALNIQNGSTGNTVRNNVLYNYHLSRGSIIVSADSLPGLVSDHNVVMDRLTANNGTSVLSLAGWRLATGLDANSVVATPAELFADAAGRDFHLKAGSPAIDRGTATGAPATDYEGHARPQGAVHDIGHDEYVSTLPPPPPPPPPLPPPPPPPPVSGQPFAVGSDAGRVATVTLYNADGTVRFAATPFGAASTAGVKVATGDVTGDGVADVVAGGPGQVRVIDGATGQVRPGAVFSSSTYAGLVEVAVGDVTGDGVADVAVGTDENGARVRVYRGGDFARLADFRALGGRSYRGVGRVALADVTGDGRADLAASGLYSDGTHVAVFTGTSLRPKVKPARAFPELVLAGGGVNLAAGDLNADGHADLIFGSASGGPRVLALSGRDLVQSGARTTLVDFAPVGDGYAGGVRVGLRDLDNDGRADLLLGSGTGNRVTAYLGPTGSSLALDLTVYAGFTGGLYVG